MIMQSEERQKYHVAGGNIASLICFDQIKTNRKGRFFVFGNLGSGWSGITRGNELLDLGQRYFELDFENANQRTINEYSETENLRDFTEAVKSFITSKGFELVEARVEAFFRGQIIRCPLETTDLSDVVNCLSDKEKDAIRVDISRQTNSPKQDMSTYGYSSHAAAMPNLHDMLLHNHGTTFNDLVIFPFTDKFQIPLEQVPTRLRRKVWAPIFYSRTILSHLDGAPDFFPSRRHFKIKSQSTSKLIQSLIEAHTKSGRQAVEKFNIKQDMFHLGDDKKFQIDSLKYGASLNPILNVLGHVPNIEKLNIRLMWFRVPNSAIMQEIDYLSVIDKDIPLTRISTSSWSSDPSCQIYCVETFDKQISAEEAFSQLRVMALIRENTEMNKIADLSAPAMDRPTLKNEKAYNEMIQTVQEKMPRLDIDLVAKQFGRNTFNDQVLSGLKKAQEINDECS